MLKCAFFSLQVQQRVCLIKGTTESVMRMSSSRGGRVDPSLPNQQSASSSSSYKEANSLKTQQPVPSSSRRKCFDPYNSHPLYRLGILSSVTEVSVIFVH